MEDIYYATGKRKTSIARVWLKTGDGNIVVNDKNLKDYFKRSTSEMLIKQPLDITGGLEKYDISATVCGGGLSGQAGALRHGIAKALIHSDPAVRLTLKRAGLLTRDSRIKERKKYGKKGARKSFQFTKR